LLAAVRRVARRSPREHAGEVLEAR
jgi:hypothetical protein